MFTTLKPPPPQSEAVEGRGGKRTKKEPDGQAGDLGENGLSVRVWFFAEEQDGEPREGGSGEEVSKAEKNVGHLCRLSSLPFLLSIVHENTKPERLALEFWEKGEQTREIEHSTGWVW